MLRMEGGASVEAAEGIEARATRANEGGGEA